MTISRAFVALLAGVTLLGATGRACGGGQEEVRSSLSITDCPAPFAKCRLALPWLKRATNLCCINGRLHGQVVDFTCNHGADRRIWSASLGQRRDLYVYLPPGYDPRCRYPAALYLHGATQDEQFFLENIVQSFDKAMALGLLPPAIIVSPDGSLQGRPSLLRTASFFANTRAGNFEDFVIEDVWNFALQTFPIRPEAEAHAIMGVSMGGSAAIAQAIKHRDLFKVAVGVMPALNTRWVDCCGRYETPFDPDCWGWRTKPRPYEVIARPPGIVKVRFKHLFGPLVGCRADAMARLSDFNPIEILERSDLKDGELAIYLAYGGRDEFNIKTQVDSFLYLARQRGLKIDVGYDPEGRHDLASGRRLLPDALRWIAPLMAPFDPRKKE